MTQNSQPRSRAASAIETARYLYRGVFAAQTEDEQEIASQTWLALEPRDRSFIATHLQYLNLMAHAQTLKMLQGIRETLDNLTGATYAIADAVVSPMQDGDAGMALDDPDFLDETLDQDDYRGVVPERPRRADKPGILAEAFRHMDRPSSQPSGTLEDARPPMIIPSDPVPLDPFEPTAQPDAGQIAASVLPVPPRDGISLADAFHAAGVPARKPSNPRAAADRRRSGRSSSTTLPAEGVPHEE